MHTKDEFNKQGGDRSKMGSTKTDKGKGGTGLGQQQKDKKIDK